MKSIKVTNTISDNFLNFLNKRFYSLCAAELEKNSRSDIFNFIFKSFKITIADIENILSNKILTQSKVGDVIYISINENLRINNIPLKMLLNLIDYGDLSHKGLNIFNNSLIYIENNLPTIYKIFLITRRKEK